MTITPKAQQPFLTVDPEAVKSNSKKVKNNPSSDNGYDKFPRIWSEEDEMVLLKGMIEYKAKKGVDPLLESVEFHDSIKESLQTDMTKRQMTDKSRQMRTKYMDEGAVFSKPHDKACLDLVREIWPPESNGVGKTRKKKRKKHGTDGAQLKVQMNGDCNEEKVEDSCGEFGKVEVKDQEDEEEVIFDDYPCLMGSLERGKAWSLPDYWKGFLLERIGQIGKEKLNEMEAKWRSLQQAETRLMIRRVELVQEQAKLALDLLKGTQD